MRSAFIAVTLALTVISPSLAQAGDVSCNRLATLRSRNGDTAVAITFVNTSSQPRKLIWIGYDGEQVAYATIAPGQTLVQPTFATHPWLVTDTAGSCVEIFVATNVNRTVALQ